MNFSQNKGRWKFYDEWEVLSVCVFRISRMHPFSGALKTRFLLFQKLFQVTLR